MTALYAQPSRSVEAPTITSIAHVTHPEEHQINISLARMMGIDYVFLCSDNPAPNNREIMRLAFQLCEELDLAPENTMFMLTEVDFDALEDNFQQCQIRWIDGYPIELKRQTVTSAAQIDYLETLLEHSSNYRSYIV